MTLPRLPEAKSVFVCECEEWMRTACAEEPFYNEHEGKRYCVLHFPAKEKSADFKKALEKKLAHKDFDFRGVWFPDDISFSNLHFRAAAAFTEATFSGKANFIQTTFGVANFSKATFGSAADFTGATFRSAVEFTSAIFRAATDFTGSTFRAPVDFTSAIFRAAADFSYGTFIAVAAFNSTTFRSAADFNSATFHAIAAFNSTTFRSVADFKSTIFKATANFGGTTFTKPAYFSQANFNEVADFAGATFSDAVYFGYATFNGKLNLNEVTFRDYVKFAGTEDRPAFSDTSSLDLQFAKIEEPDHLSFHTLTLRPHWFVNVDARKFAFINIEWHVDLKQEILDLREYSLVGSAQRLLEIACRNLALNAEENHRYDDASKLRYLAMNARRRESFGRLAAWRLSWWYWLVSGYGERVIKAFLVLLAVWFVAAVLYTQVGFARWEPKLASENDLATEQHDAVGAPLNFSRALTYSVAVMTFQRPEPRPATTAAHAVVLLETILGPVQAALLALAIRRKFMR